MRLAVTSPMRAPLARLLAAAALSLLAACSLVTGFGGVQLVDATDGAEDGGTDGDSGVNTDADAEADAARDGDADADADGPGDADADGEPGAARRLDMLFVVDDSSSMAEEQTILAEQVHVLLEELLSPTPDGSGSVPPAVEDLHVGVVTTDLGSLGHTVMTCSDPLDGDGGALQTAGGRDGCAEEYRSPCERPDGCPWLEHSAERPDDGRDPGDPPIWEDLGCVGTVGTAGCGFEMQLEAGLVALTDAAAPGGPNEGFLREDAGLVVVFVTDEDDCSSGNPLLLDPGATDLPPLGVRCALRSELLFNLNRYYDGFTALKPGREDQVVVVAIVGLPVDGSWEPGDPIEELQAMVQLAPENPNTLVPSCFTPRGNAYPPARIAELVYRFGANGVLFSICDGDWTEGLRNAARRIQSRIPT